MEYSSNNVRNVLVLGHQGSGKTTLVETISALVSGNKKGTVEQKNTISDFTKEEQNRLSSCQIAIVPVEYNNYKINFIDAPGNADFIYEALGAVKVVNLAIVVIDASSGVQPETVKHYRMLKSKKVPTFIFVNKLDKANINYQELLDDIHAKLDKKAPIEFALPFGLGDSFNGYVNIAKMVGINEQGECEIPAGLKDNAAELHSKLEEQVALTDDALLDKFFGGTELTDEEMTKGLHTGVINCDLVPILCGSLAKNIGWRALLQMTVDYMPYPEERKPFEGFNEKKEAVQIKHSDTDPVTLFCFKTYFDPFKGVINLCKVLRGTLNQGDELYIARNGETVRLSSLVFLKGNAQTPTTKVVAGDIVGLQKCEDVKINDTLYSKGNYFELAPTEYPNAVFFKALLFKDPKEEEKIVSGLGKLQLENPCIEMKRNPETKQLLIGGCSESFLAFLNERMKNLFNVELTFGDQKVVYRETIKATASAEGRYVKQSGGGGMYGIVTMRFEPCEGESHFDEEIFGGAVPKNYFPAVEKGFFEALQSGGLAGFPVLGVHGVLVDGKYHSVDSNDLSFKMAAILSFKEAYQKCKPTILEPIMKLEIVVDEEYTGSILNDLTPKRGRVMSIDDAGDGQQRITALVPEAEILDYASKLRGITKGSGVFSRTFESYEEAPSNLIPGIIQANSLLKKE